MQRWDAVRKWLVLPVVVLPVVALLLAAGAADEKKGADADKAAVRGTWQAVSSEMDGEKQPDEEVKAYTLVFSGDKLAVNKEGSTVMSGSYTLDPARKPAHLDFKLEENPNNPDDVGKTLPGIYDLKGDELKWCFSLPDRGERPKAFKTEGGSSQVSATLKREKK